MVFRIKLLTGVESSRGTEPYFQLPRGLLELTLNQGQGISVYISWNWITLPKTLIIFQEQNTKTASSKLFERNTAKLTCTVAQEPKLLF